jgi:GTPase SAR1 family protein
MLKKPTLIIIAGPNGSGKTSITSKILKHEWVQENRTRLIVGLCQSYLLQQKNTFQTRKLPFACYFLKGIWHYLIKLFKHEHTYLHFVHSYDHFSTAMYFFIVSKLITNLHSNST